MFEYIVGDRKYTEEEANAAATTNAVSFTRVGWL